MGGTLEAETAADAKKLDVAADSHRRGGDASDEATSDAWMDTSAKTRPPRLAGDPYDEMDADGDGGEEDEGEGGVDGETAGLLHVKL